MTNQQRFTKLMKAFDDANNKPYTKETYKDDEKAYERARSELITFIYTNRNVITVGSAKNR